MLAPPRSWRPRPLQEEARRGAAADPPWPPRAPGPVPDVPEAAGGRAGFLPLLPGVLLHQQGELLRNGSPERPGRRRRLKPGPRDTWRLAARLPAPSPHEMGGEGVVAPGTPLSRGRSGSRGEAELLGGDVAPPESAEGGVLAGEAERGCSSCQAASCVGKDAWLNSEEAGRALM